MKYMLIMQMDPQAVAALSEEEQNAIMEAHGDFQKTITDTGEMISTHALDDPSNSSVVRVRDGAADVAEGPFVESRTFMAGFYLVECETQERAREIAAQIPDAKVEGLGIEVRPVVFSAGEAA